LISEVATWIRDELDLEQMVSSTKSLIGRQDFAAWQSAGSPSPTTVRDVRRIEIRRTTAFESSLVEIEIEADAFLYQMVRNIVGALMEAGRGKLNADDIARLTLGLDRTKCPPPAPPQGLCLVRVEY
jgi:tRNA pseudouridine38-40 synthase